MIGLTPSEYVQSTRGGVRPPRVRKAYVSVAVILALAGGWQLLSVLDKTTGPSPLIPGWEWIVTRGFPDLANYQSGFGVFSGPGGTRSSYSGAFRVLLESSAISWLRMMGGFVGGAIIGIVLALAISWSQWARRLLAVPAHTLRMVPALSLIPLFQLWFGVGFMGVFMFIAFAVGIIFFVGVLNAVGNVPSIYVSNARTLGASRARVFRTIVLPGIFPEVRSSLLLGIGLSWTLLIGAEYSGAQGGLGFIVVAAYSFALLDRMLVVGLLLSIYATLSVALVAFASKPLIRWMPSSTRL